MPIQLDKILSDIAAEKVLHPSYPDASKKDMDDAWSRVGHKNKLSVHEARSIFKVLQKKYEQEKQKDTSAWKLYNIMDEIHRKIEFTPQIKQEDDGNDLPMEEDEEYEMLEVQEEDEHIALAQAASSASTSTSDAEVNISTDKSQSTPDKDDKSTIKTCSSAKSTGSNSTASTPEEKKLLNTMASASPRPPPTNAAQTPSVTAANLQKKGITLKKTTVTNNSNNNSGRNHTTAKNLPTRVGGTILEVGKAIQLPESIKRKLTEEHLAIPQFKKVTLPVNHPHIAQVNANKSTNSTTSSQNSNTNTTQSMQIKQEPEDSIAATAHGINFITIPANPTRAELANSLGVGSVGGGPSAAGTVASTSTNGFSPCIEDIDFRNDIIFDSGNGINGTVTNKMNSTHSPSEIINLGNFDNSLPPTFFKNLCNSSRHEALGLYVANVANRLRSRSAAKLELAILRAIIDVQADELEQ